MNPAVDIQDKTCGQGIHRTAAEDRLRDPSPKAWLALYDLYDGRADVVVGLDRYRHAKLRYMHANTPLGKFCYRLRC